MPGPIRWPGCAGDVQMTAAAAGGRWTPPSAACKEQVEKCYCLPISNTFFRQPHVPGLSPPAPWVQMLGPPGLPQLGKQTKQRVSIKNFILQLVSNNMNQASINRHPSPQYGSKFLQVEQVIPQNNWKGFLNRPTDSQGGFRERICFRQYLPTTLQYKTLKVIICK